MPERYTAQAYIRGEFVASDTLPMQVKNMRHWVHEHRTYELGPGARDRDSDRGLLQSNRLARRVVQQLGLERLQPLSEPTWMAAGHLPWSAAQSPEDQVDIAAGKLLNGLSVTAIPRAYLITVRYTHRRSGALDTYSECLCGRASAQHADCRCCSSSATTRRPHYRTSWPNSGKNIQRWRS